MSGEVGETQKRIIEAIERETKYKFRGLTKVEASAFISLYYAEYSLSKYIKILLLEQTERDGVCI